MEHYGCTMMMMMMMIVTDTTAALIDISQFQVIGGLLISDINDHLPVFAIGANQFAKETRFVQNKQK